MNKATPPADALSATGKHDSASKPIPAAMPINGG
jgi:hypothetical protein